MSRILGDSLPQNIIDLLNKEITTVIVSTITSDGFPHALPIGLTYVPDTRTIRMGLMKGHQSVANIKDNGKAMITVCDAPDLACGIRCTAQVIKEPMDANAAMVMVECKVEQVKSDKTPTAAVIQGIRIQTRTERGAEFFRNMMDELKAHA